MHKITRSIVINAANHLRWSNRIGIIKKGYWADIIAIESDLEKDINALLSTRFVMKGRRLSLTRHL